MRYICTITGFINIRWCNNCCTLKKKCRNTKLLFYALNSVKQKYNSNLNTAQSQGDHRPGKPKISKNLRFWEISEKKSENSP